MLTTSCGSDLLYVHSQKTCLTVFAPSDLCKSSAVISFTVSTFQLVLVSPTGEQYDSLLRHLRERIDEGCGETIYVVGMGSGKS